MHVQDVKVEGSTTWMAICMAVTASIVYPLRCKMLEILTCTHHKIGQQ